MHRCFPGNLKLAKIVPLFKSRNPHLLDHYRPISVLSIGFKIFEKVMLQQVYSYFTNNKLFYGNQYGFRTHHSTELTVIELIDRISGNIYTSKIPFLPLSIYPKLSILFENKIIIMMIMINPVISTHVSIILLNIHPTLLTV